MTIQRKRRAQQPLRRRSETPKKRKPKAAPKPKKQTHSAKPKNTQRIQRSSKPQRPKRRVSRPNRNLNDTLVQVFIVVFILINLLLVFFIVKQCSRKPVPAVEVKKPEITSPLQIEVLNGCGVAGVASSFTDFLRLKGFDVVRMENYETFNVLHTIVIDRRGNVKNCMRIANELGLGKERILQEVNEAYLIDATVILGKDYRQLRSWQVMETAFD